MTKKDTKIAQLKAKLTKVSEQGPSLEEVSELKAQNAQLTAKVEELKDKLLKSHDEADARLTLDPQNLNPKPSSS